MLAMGSVAESPALVKRTWEKGGRTFGAEEKVVASVISLILLSVPHFHCGCLPSISLFSPTQTFEVSEHK